MGAGESQPGGYRIFTVTPGSPLYEGGVEPFFDYIVRISGLPVDSIEAHQVGPLFESKKGRPVELSLYSLRTQSGIYDPGGLVGRYQQILNGSFSAVSNEFCK